MVTEQSAAADPVEDTAAPAEVAPPPLAFGHDEPDVSDEPEAATEVEAPETVPAESPETPEIESPPVPEAPDITALLADMPDEEFEKLDRVSRSRESVRRRAESETARRVQTAQESDFLAGKYGSAIADYVQRAETGVDGKVQIDSKQFDSVAGDMWGAASRMAYRAAESILKEAVGEDYRIPATLQNRIDSTQDEVTRGTKPLEDLLKVRQEVALAAQLEAERPKLRKEIEGEVRKEMAQEKVVAGRKAASETNANEAAPTRVGGAPASNTVARDFDHAEEMWLGGDMTDKDYKAWREHAGIPAIPR